MRCGLLLALFGALGIFATADTATVPSTARDPLSLSSLWEAPRDLDSGDLFSGPWGPGYAPDPHAVFTFIRTKQRGLNPGVVVRDPAGRTWHVKQTLRNGPGSEGPVEVVISRVLSAVGYRQPPVYYLSSFTMKDRSGATRLEPGGRFRLDEPSLHDRGTWSWTDNPFVGSRPFNGLLVILLMFNSWDLKNSNNSIYDLRQPNGVGSWYVVRDLGGALGDGGGLRPKRNNPEAFERQTFVRRVDGRFVEFAYRGKQPDLVRRRITVEDVRWASNLLAPLSDKQWHDMFRAGGYTPDVSERFIRKLRANILEGQRLGSDGWRTAQERR